MRLYFERALRSLVTRPGFTSPVVAMSAKRGDAQVLELRIYDDGVAGTLAADPEIRFGIKETLDGEVLALADTWTLAAGVYTAAFNTNTAELVAALGEADSKVFLAELTYSDADGGPTSSQTISFTIQNDVLKDEDGTPLGLPGPDDYVAARAVLYDREQELTSPQQAQARANIGALAADPASARSALSVRPSRPYLHGSPAGILAFMRAADRGQSAAIKFVGDSTFYSSSGIPIQLGSWLAARYPDHRIVYNVLKTDSTGLTETVVAAGAEPRHWYFGTGSTTAKFMPSSQERTSPAGTAKLSFECEIALDAGRITAGLPNANILLCGFGSGGTPSYFLLNAAGRLEVYWRDAGGSFVFDTNSSSAVVAGGAMVAGTKYSLRVDVEANSGGFRYTRYYTSTDSGVTWTQLGVDRVQAASSFGIAAGAGYWIGHYGGTPTTLVKYYQANVLIGANRERILPHRIDFFRPVSGDVAANDIIGGSPILWIDNLSRNGSSVLDSDFWNQSGATGFPDNAYRIVVDRGDAAIFWTDGHNAESGTPATFWVGMDTLRTNVLARLSNDPAWVIVTQNPELPTYPQALAADLRQTELLTKAAISGHAIIDLHQVAYDDGRALSLLLADSVHPTIEFYGILGTAFRSCLLAGTDESI